MPRKSKRITKPWHRYFCWVDVGACSRKRLGIKGHPDRATLPPTLAPDTQQFDDGPEILACWRKPGEMAFAARFRLDMHDAGLLKTCHFWIELFSFLIGDGAGDDDVFARPPIDWDSSVRHLVT